jgi:transcription elongation factor Elf1
MQYPLKCNKCNHKKILDISLKQYEEGKPFSCKCGGDYDRFYPKNKLTGIQTKSSPSRF